MTTPTRRVSQRLIDKAKIDEEYQEKSPKTKARGAKKKDDKTSPKPVSAGKKIKIAADTKKAEAKRTQWTDDEMRLLCRGRSLDASNNPRKTWLQVEQALYACCSRAIRQSNTCSTKVSIMKKHKHPIYLEYFGPNRKSHAEIEDEILTYEQDPIGEADEDQQNEHSIDGDGDVQMGGTSEQSADGDVDEKMKDAQESDEDDESDEEEPDEKSNESSEEFTSGETPEIDPEEAEAVAEALERWAQISDRVYDSDEELPPARKYQRPKTPEPEVPYPLIIPGDDPVHMAALGVPCTLESGEVISLERLQAWVAMGLSAPVSVLYELFKQRERDELEPELSSERKDLQGEGGTNLWHDMQ
ncbi:MAG: hypothetical protein M1829_006102 [Trizodia sp. TS-e1964]|nr:MAG: hypothetical protein M1829_006102 [Trizodia sp. TS-e1964]